MADQDNLSGRKLGGFVLRERIAEGGFGAVYCCEQPLLGREAVVKILHPERLRSSVSVQRFLREARLASRLDHPYAAHIYAFGIEERDRLLWIAMERVQGITLAAWLTTHGPMPLGQLVPLFERIAVVVQTAHDRGIVHRDLKPSNVMVLERAGELLPKLLDLGVAKLLDGAALEGMPEPEIDYQALLATNHLPAKRSGKVRVGPSTVTDPDAPPLDSSLTPSNYTVGSPAYISPEQWDHAGAVGPASDLYALAVVAFEALTGRRPFEAATMFDYAHLHRTGAVPALGGDFPPELDRMFHRALAKRPQDRWGTALELAGALRAGSGIGTSSADLPRIEAGVRDAWLAGAPQPLAESVAALDRARNAHQAHIATQELAKSLLRYLLAVALATHAQTGESRDDPALLRLVRALDRRELSTEDRVRLVRLLVRPLISRRGAHPIPELIDLVTPDPDDADGLDPMLALFTATGHGTTEDAVRLQLMRLTPELTQLLRKTAFVLDYALVVPQRHAAERWTGRRRKPRAATNVVHGELIDGHPMLLDRAGRVSVDLWPLVQTVPPIEGAEPELFLFDGHGHHGALMIAAPSGLEHHDAILRDWVATRVIAEIEAKTRMRERIRIAAHQWQDRVRPHALLWRGEVLADLERWTLHTSAAGLSDLEAAFVAASLRVGRRTRWTRRLLAALAVAAVLSGLQYRAMQETRVAQEQARMAQQFADLSVIQAEVEQGRQALLHDDFAEALLHLSEAYRRGDHSPATVFMLARALQPRLAERARFTAAAGRMWSAMFSPDGKRIVTTDDRSARMWDAESNQLLFTMNHGDTVYQAVFSPDGSRIITAGGDGTVGIWNAATGAPIHKLTYQRLDAKHWRYYAVAMSSHLVAAIDLMGRVAHVWDADTGMQIGELDNDESELASLAFSTDGHWLVTSGGDDVRVFDTSTWKQAVTIAGPRVRSLSFDPTGLRLAVGTYDGIASIWEIPSGMRVRYLRQAGASVDAIAFSRDGTLVATASRDGTEQVWDATSGGLRTQFNSHHNKIYAVEFALTGNLILSAGADGAVVVSNVATGMLVARLEGPKGLVFAAHFDPESRRVVGASWDGASRVWDATPPYRRWNSPPIGAECDTMDSIVPDRRFIALSCRSHGTHVWDTLRGERLAELPSVTTVEGDYYSAFPALTDVGDRAAIARGNTVELYALPSGRLLRTIAHPAAVNAVAFAPAGHDLVSGAVDGSLMIMRDDRDPIALPTSLAGIDAVAILADGRIVAADASSRLRIIDPGRNALLVDLAAPYRVRLLRPSPDGTRLITIATRDKQTPPALWDLDHHRLVAQLNGHVGRVFAARFVAGSHEILTAGADGTARLWDAATGNALQSYHGDSHFLADAALAPDGSMVVAGGSDGLLRFWDASSGRLLWTLQAHKSYIVGVHYEGRDIVTRAFAGDVSRSTLPSPERVIEACQVSLPASAVLAGKNSDCLFGRGIITR
jgi:WD40 repeat protein/serine/threonine protein kinase